MDIRLNRSLFLGELAPMQGIVERRTTIPVLSHLLLDARGDGLRIAGTDLDVSLTSSVDAEVSREGAIAVQAKKFIEIIRALAGDKVRLVLDGNALTITAGGSRFRIHGLPAADFPTLPDVGGEARGDSVLAVQAHGRPRDLRGVERGVALPAERRAAQAQSRERSRWWRPTAIAWR